MAQTFRSIRIARFLFAFSLSEVATLVVFLSESNSSEALIHSMKATTSMEAWPKGSNPWWSISFCQLLRVPCRRMSTISSSARDWVSSNLGGNFRMSSELMRVMFMWQLLMFMSKGFLASHRKWRLTCCNTSLGGKPVIIWLRAEVTMGSPSPPSLRCASLVLAVASANACAKLATVFGSPPWQLSTASWAAVMSAAFPLRHNWLTLLLWALSAVPRQNCCIIWCWSDPVAELRQVNVCSTFLCQSMRSRGDSAEPFNVLNAKRTLVESTSVGSLWRSTVTRSSFLVAVSVGSGTNGRTILLFLVLPKSLVAAIFMVEWSWKTNKLFATQRFVVWCQNALR